MIPFPLDDGQLPDIFMTATPQMIASFKMFGDGQFVSFDVTYNLIKEIKIEVQEDKSVRKKWGLGMFLGKNNNNKTICFCICLLNSEKKEDLKGVFTSFFEMMKGEPSAFISDEQPAIEGAIKELKEEGSFQGEHFLDTFHILRNINKKTKKSNLVGFFREAIFAKTHEEYKINLEKARENCD